MKETLQLSANDCIDIISVVEKSELEPQRKEQIQRKLFKIMTQKSLPLAFTQEIGSSNYKVMIHAGARSELFVSPREQDGIFIFRFNNVEYRINFNGADEEAIGLIEETGYLLTLYDVSFRVSEQDITMDLDVYLVDDEDYDSDADSMLLSKSILDKHNILLVD